MWKSCKRFARLLNEAKAVSTGNVCKRWTLRWMRKTPTAIYRRSPTAPCLGEWWFGENGKQPFGEGRDQFPAISAISAKSWLRSTCAKDNDEQTFEKGKDLSKDFASQWLPDSIFTCIAWAAESGWVGWSLFIPWLLSRRSPAVSCNSRFASPKTHFCSFPATKTDLWV